MGRPRRYSMVTSSGATIPARAPASMAMLHMVMRASIDSARTASPQNSITEPVPPAVPMMPMMCSTRSLEVTPGASPPSTRMAMFLLRFCSSVCVARTCSTSEVPMPKAREPKAPCVEVCESPQTMVMPGCVKPCSGPITCTIPWRVSSMPKYWMPNSATLRSRAITCVRESSSRMKEATSVKPAREEVGTLWSTVARVFSGWRTRRPAARRPSKACGEVTSCTRWRSI
mmetsp:Transcript_4003/g.14241  ORF Transcript_4003/g.14241 Transcript_4003/m.14241 type:complete len:229 (-) Transcript_4003:353-1039(-)